MKFLLAFLPLLLAAQPNLTPSTPPVVKQGTTQSFVSDVPVTWSLTGAGTLATVDSTHATYTAPASVVPQNVVSGCQIHPNTHIFNVNISGLSLDTNSATYMSNIGPATRLTFSTGGDFPANPVKSTDATTNMVFNYTTSQNGAFLIPPYPLRKIESGEFTYRTQNNDHHIMIEATDTCDVQEVYQLFPAGWVAGKPTVTSSSGTKYAAPGYLLSPVGTDAAGLELHGLILHADELHAGAIKHALRMTLAAGYFDTSCHIWPATADNGSNTCSNPTRLPYGGRLRLKAAYNDAALSATSKVITAALKNYGLILADIGGSWQIQADATTFTAADRAAFAELQASGPQSSDFEIVNDQGLKVDPLYGMTTASGYVAVTGTAITGGLTKTVHVALQGVAVGRRYPNMVVQAGTPAITLDAWVTGSSNTAFTCSMSPTVGTLSGCNYTPPATSAVKQTTVVTITASADATVSNTINISVLPQGTVRVNTGDTADYTDGSANVWYADMKTGDPLFINTSGYPYAFGSVPSWTNTSDGTLFNNAMVALQDIEYRLWMPNGNYLVNMYFGADDNASNLRWMYLEANGQVGKHNYDYFAAAGAARKVNTVTIPATVSNGQLQIVARQHGTPPMISNACCTDTLFTNGYSPMISAFTVTTDPAAPNLSIENLDGAGSNVTIGTKHTLYCVSGGGLATGCTFAITSGAGTITAIDSTSATYTAPSTPPPVASPQTVTITATSTADGTKTATTTFVRVFGTIGVTAAYSTVTRQLTDQFSANLSGTAYTNVTWTANKGSITSGGLWTAPNTSVDTTAIITATSLDDGSQAATSTVTVKAAPAEMYAHFGDSQPDVTDTAGKVWISETHLPNFSLQGQSIAVTCNQQCVGKGSDGTATIFGLSDSAQQALYQGAHYGYQYSTPIGDVIATFTIPPGTYKVTLKFADYGPTYRPTTFQQDIVANGVTLISSFNFAAAAGAARTAIDKTYTVTNSGNSLALSFLHNGALLPQVNAISVVYQAPVTAGAPSLLQGGGAGAGIQLQ